MAQAWCAEYAAMIREEARCIRDMPLVHRVSLRFTRRPNTLFDAYVIVARPEDTTPADADVELLA